MNDQERAEKIAEFLDGILRGPTHNSTHKFGNHKEKVWDFDDSGGACLESGLIDWLSSDAGTVAMIYKLMKTQKGREEMHLALSCVEPNKENLPDKLQAVILELLQSSDQQS